MTSNCPKLLQIPAIRRRNRTQRFTKLWHIAHDFINMSDMSRSLTLLLLIALCFMLSCQGNKQESKSEVVQPEIKMPTKDDEDKVTKKVILCFGNSLTAGFGLDENQAWPFLMQERIDSLSLPYTVINAGLSGETSAGGLGRIDWVLNQPVDYFILELGANDMLRGLNVKATRENLNGILKRVVGKNPNIKIVIAGMLSPPNMGPDYERAFNAIFPDLSKEFNAIHLPFFLEGVAGIDSLNLADGKHPNEIGQKIVLENVWKSLESII